jgi:hypothetical protein
LITGVTGRAVIQRLIRQDFRIDGHLQAMSASNNHCGFVDGYRGLDLGFARV